MLRPILTDQKSQNSGGDLELRKRPVDDLRSLAGVAKIGTGQRIVKGSLRLLQADLQYSTPSGLIPSRVRE